METSRTRTKDVTHTMVSNLDWLWSREHLFSRYFGSEGNTLFAFYRGAAYHRTEYADSGAITATMTDKVGRSSEGMSRFFPDAWPYRSLTLTRPRPTRGSVATDVMPSASAAHSFNSYYATVKPIVAANVETAVRISQTWPADQGRWEVRVSGNDLIVEYKAYCDWVRKDLVAGNTVSEARAIAQLRGDALKPNLIKGGIAVVRELDCVVNPNYDATPPSAGVKSLSNEEEAALIDARREAYESMIHGISGTKVNVLRSIMELKDVPGTVTSVGDFLKTACAVSSIMRRKKLTGLGKTGLATELTLAQLAGIHLWYQFGVKPSRQDAELFLKHLGELPLAQLAKAEEPVLTTGQTVRSAYSIDNRVLSTRLENRVRVQTIKQGPYSIILRENEKRPLTLYALQNGATSLPNPSLPKGNSWHHSGVLFGRALKPDWENMPSWFTDLFAASGVDGSGGFGDVVLRPPQKGSLWLYFNPPVKSAWNIMGYSWLADWAWNASRVLTRLERTAQPLQLKLEEHWAVDTWELRPERWSMLPVVEEPVLQQTNDVIYVGAEWATSSSYNIQGQVLPRIRMINAAVTTPRATVTNTVHLNYLCQTPPTSVWRCVGRYRIPKPPVRIPEWFEGKLDEWRIGILCALSVSRLTGMSSALRKAKWSVARCATMWRRSPEFDSRVLWLAIVGIVAAKEFNE